MMELIEYKKDGTELLIFHIEHCQKSNHQHQVAYSTYHKAITQICFTCSKVRTTMQI